MLRAWFLHRPGQRSRGHGRVRAPRAVASLVTEMESLEGRALLTATSAVSWLSGLVTHHAFYAIAPNDSVEVSFGGGTFKSPGGYAKQISATMDSTVCTISGDNAVYKNSGGVWVPRGGYAKQISAAASQRSSPSVSTTASGSTTGAPGSGTLRPVLLATARVIPLDAP